MQGDDIQSHIQQAVESGLKSFMWIPEWGGRWEEREAPPRGHIVSSVVPLCPWPQIPSLTTRGDQEEVETEIWGKWPPCEKAVVEGEKKSGEKLKE